MDLPKKKKSTKLTAEDRMNQDLDEQYHSKPKDEYQGSNDVVDAANSALSKGKQMNKEVERQEFMKMNPAEKAEFVKGLSQRMKKRNK